MSNQVSLLIGGNGFIGKNLAEQLLSEGHEVIIYDSSKPFNESENVKYIVGSIENTSLLTEVATPAQNIIWLVHTSVPATSMNDVESDLSSNIPPLIRFLQRLCRDSKEKKFIYLSSGGTVYGDPLNLAPINEGSTKDPISSYGLTKLIAEEYLTFILKRSTITTFVLRPSNVYGRFQNLSKPQGIIGHAFKSVLLDQPIAIYGDGSVIRDYVHVSDLAKAVILCIKSTNDSKFPMVLNIGSGRKTSITEIIEMITEVTDSLVKINRLSARDFDCKFNVLDVEKARIEIGWEPKVDLRDGLLDVWKWIKENSNSL